jgi:hypothetical protein
MQITAGRSWTKYNRCLPTDTDEPALDARVPGDNDAVQFLLPAREPGAGQRSPHVCCTLQHTSFDQRHGFDLNLQLGQRERPVHGELVILQ